MTQCVYRVEKADEVHPINGPSLAASWACQNVEHDAGADGQVGHELPPNAVAKGLWSKPVA